jgi:hypothetical protein
MFANVMEQSLDAWQACTWPPSTSFPHFVSGVTLPATDQNGYPIGLGNLASEGDAIGTFVFTNNGAYYPTGNYTLNFSGQGTIAILNGGAPQYFTQGSGSPSPFTVNITNSSIGIAIVITSSSASNYVRNISLVIPGSESTYKTNPFNPQFLQAAQPFSTLRMPTLPDLGSSTTSDGQSGPLTWADRTTPTYFTQATPAGPAVEYMVDLANTLQENMWVSISVNASSGYLTKFAHYCAANLDSNLKLYVEYGDELWNPTWVYEWNYVQLYANANGISHQVATADLTSNCFSYFSQAYAHNTKGLVRVVSTQFVYPALLNPELTQIVALASPSDPDHGFDAVSGGAYFGPDTSSYNASTTVSQIESDFVSSLSALQTSLQSFMSVTDSWEATLNQNIPVVMYEGGPAITAKPTDSWYQAYLALQTDSGMGPVVTDYLNDLSAGGVQGVNYNNFIQLPGSGEWGSMAYLGQPSSQTPKYNAIVSYIDSTKVVMSSLPTSSAVGTPQTLTITVYNPNRKGVDTWYIGTVQLTSTDLQTLLPVPYAFTAANAGVHYFTVTLRTSGTSSLSATDLTSGIVATQSSAVVPAPVADLFIKHDTTLKRLHLPDPEWL